MRPTRLTLCRGRCPLALRAHPQDIFGQMKHSAAFICPTNIPAGGSALSIPRNVSEQGAENSSFKNFGGQGAYA